MKNYLSDVLHIFLTIGGAIKALLLVVLIGTLFLGPFLGVAVVIGASNADLEPTKLWFLTLLLGPFTWPLANRLIQYSAGPETEEEPKPYEGVLPPTL